MSGNGYDNELQFQKCHEVLVKLTLDVQFIFECGDDVVKIPANKAVLAASSSVFNAMFNGELKEKGDIKITDASPEAFREFLQFFYDPQVKLTIDNIAGVLKLVDKYDITDGLSVCSDFLKKNWKIDDVLWTWHLAILFNLDNLKTFCEQTIRQKYKTVFEMLSFENGRMCVPSGSRLSNADMENISAHIFMIFKDIISNVPEKIGFSLVTLTSGLMSSDSFVAQCETMEFKVNTAMLLTGIIYSSIAISDEYVTHSFRMAIFEIGTPFSLFPPYEQKVTIDGDGAQIELQKPIRLNSSNSYIIRFLSFDIPQGVRTQKANIPDQPIEIAPSINIHFPQKNGKYDHSLISQLYFKKIDID